LVVDDRDLGGLTMHSYLVVLRKGIFLHLLKDSFIVKNNCGMYHNFSFSVPLSNVIKDVKKSVATRPWPE